MQVFIIGISWGWQQKLIFSLCEHFGTEIVIINRTEDSTFEEDLAQDVLEIIEARR